MCADWRRGGRDRIDDDRRITDRGRLWERGRPRFLQPRTSAEIDRENKLFRGELRWDGRDWVQAEPFEHIKREDYAKRVLREVKLSDTIETDRWPKARDVLSSTRWAEIDLRKLSDYSMNPEHPRNGGKWRGWRDLGWEVFDRDRRIEDSWDVHNKILDLLPEARVEKRWQTRWGEHCTAWSGLIGPNGRHATLVTGWMENVEKQSPQLVTAFLKVHRERHGDAHEGP